MRDISGCNIENGVCDYNSPHGTLNLRENFTMKNILNTTLFLFLVINTQVIIVLMIYTQNLK